MDPVAYNKKVEFWSELIAKYCMASKSAIADYEKLKESFKKGCLLPAPLEGVMAEMHRYCFIFINCIFIFLIVSVRENYKQWKNSHLKKDGFLGGCRSSLLVHSSI